MTTSRTGVAAVAHHVSQPAIAALRQAAGTSPAAQRLQAIQRQANTRTLQRAGPEEEPMQAKAIQRLEDEPEPMQAKAVQRAEEEEVMQGKAIQRAEDEEPMQGKAVGSMRGAAVQQQAAVQGTGGLPGQLRAGIEELSGVSMAGVQVHRNSDRPAQVGAHAYAQGRDIHLAAGQEKHLPHEAWHVVQQAQGRVQPTMQAKGIAVNDDAGLEAEADVMGARALVYPVARDQLAQPGVLRSGALVAQGVFQLMRKPNPENATLQQIVATLFRKRRPKGTRKIGDGSAMAAASYEVGGGVVVEGVNHLQKMTDTMNRLDNMHFKVKLSEADEAIWQSLFKACAQAELGKYEG